MAIGLAARKVRNKQNPYFSGLVGRVRYTVGTETSNTITVTIQYQDVNGNDIGQRAACLWYLSTDANGDNVAASAPSGGIAVGTDGLLIEAVTDKFGLMVSEADGDVDVVLTETSTPTFYLVVVAHDGSLWPSSAITFA